VNPVPYLPCDEDLGVGKPSILYTLPCEEDLEVWQTTLPREEDLGVW